MLLTYWRELYLIKYFVEPSDEAALEAVSKAFADCPRQQLVRDPNHCSECIKAEQYLTSLDRSDVALADIGDRLGFDCFSMITDEGFRHFVPALCRIALQERPAGIGHLLLRLDRAHTIIVEPHQREAIVEFLDYIKVMRYIDWNHEIGHLTQIRNRFTQQPESA
ncbi:hypothetical protein [Prosthecobacter sp.]